MAAESNSSIYSALNRDEAEIRLLELLPGSGDDQICCNLSIARLIEKPEYGALSYVWGDKNQTFDTLVNGRNFSTLESLRLCLGTFRYPEKSRILWIDSFCINQNDVSERGHQVKLMGQIYREAATVLVWIGDPHDLTQETVRVIHSSAFTHNGRTSLTGRMMPSRQFWKAVLQLSTFLECAWWSRIWTLQECLLAHELEFHWFDSCRLLRISWADLVGLVDTALSNTRGIGLKKFSEEDTSPLINTVDRFLQLDIACTYRASHTSIPPRLVDIVEFAGSRACTDPRDRVYGLLGLSAEISTMHVDYNLAVTKVYEQFILESIRSSGTLSVLAARGSFLKTQDLASWATNWIAEHTAYFDTDRNYRRSNLTRLVYNASTFSRAQTAYDGIRTLSCAGRLYDQILATFVEATNTLDTIKIIKTWYRNLQTILPRLYVATGSCDDAFCRTICGDITKKGVWDMGAKPTPVHRPCCAFDDPLRQYGPYQRIKRGAEMTSLDLFWPIETFDRSAWSLPESCTKSDLDRLKDFNMNVIRTCTGKRMFVTNMGYIGIGESCIRSGDHVAILLGSEYPFVVRPVRPGDTRTDYTFHGSCYLHGIMNGEAIEQLNLLPQPYPFIKLV